MFASLFESCNKEPVVAVFSDPKSERCEVRLATEQACKELNVPVHIFDYRLEAEALQLLGVAQIPAVILVKGGLGRVVIANKDPAFDIRLQLVAAGVKLP